jgi:hypothetical protein
MPRKTEVYTWRVSSAMKASLEEAARNTNRSVARLLDEIVAERLDAAGQENEAESKSQRRLHARAARFLGCIAGGGARRSERTRELVRARLKRRHARAR